MTTALKNGDVLTSTTKIEYKVVKLLGAGGQGEVYEVRSGKNNYALKWYFEHTATKEQKAIIENLVSRGSPDPRFLWPMDMITTKKTFGYIMGLRPLDYTGIVGLMQRKAEPSFASLCMVGFNLADGYRQLHSQGYSYRDISFGNVFFNPNNGDILICDNDNVSVNGLADSGVLGTPRFMAPEIVRGEKTPSTDTDLYSMAVLLFYIFMMHHPLEGALEANIKCFDLMAMIRLYGEKPLFIWDPHDKSNRPVAGYQDNAIVYWNIYPSFLKNLFTLAFTEGLHHPRKRIMEKQWKDVLVKLKDSIIYCQNCRSENFYDLGKMKTGAGHICWNCQRTITLPPRMRINNHLIMLNRDTKISEHHTTGNFKVNSVIAEINQHPQDPSRWGLKNVTRDVWTSTRPDGSVITIEPGKNAPLVSGIKINFGPAEGEIRTQ